MTDAATRPASAETGPIRTEIREGVGLLELNRPEKFNCIGTGLVNALDAALTRFEGDKAVRVILIAGAGKNFCTGADLEELSTLPRSREALAAFLANGHRVMRRLEDSALPVIAAVHGLCLAGGLELAMSCDIVFAAETARFGDQHARYGLIPGFGGTQRLPRQVGLRRALDLMYSARWLSAEEAFSWGLVNTIVPDAELRDAAFSYARDVAKKSRPGLAAMKSLSRRGLETSLDDGLKLELAEVVDNLRSADVKEGMAAFAARREPNFE